MVVGERVGVGGDWRGFISFSSGVFDGRKHAVGGRWSHSENHMNTTEDQNQKVSSERCVGVTNHTYPSRFSGAEDVSGASGGGAEVARLLPAQ